MQVIISKQTVSNVHEDYLGAISILINEVKGKETGNAGPLVFRDIEDFENFSVVEKDGNLILEVNDECIAAYFKICTKLVLAVLPLVKPIIALVKGLANIQESFMEDMDAFQRKLLAKKGEVEAEVDQITVH